jgi:sporulation protein YlmC with PRC-barrel domain
MGANVENPEGETLGSISDVVIHDEIGVKAVVIGIGGFLGIGQKKVAVNYEEIEHRRDEVGDVTLVFAATREQLEEAPEYQTLQDQIAEAETQQMDMQQDMMQMEQPPAPTE